MMQQTMNKIGTKPQLIIRVTFRIVLFSFKLFCTDGGRVLVSITFNFSFKIKIKKCAAEATH